jgi:hypothetical protein
MYRFRFPRIEKPDNDQLKERTRMHLVDSEPNDTLPLSSVNDNSIPLDQSLYIAIDPGPHTGWVVATQNLEFFLYGENTIHSMVPHSLNGLLERMAAFHRSQTKIIIESFTLTSRPKDPKQASITLKQIGAFNHVATRFSIKPVYQIANMRKMTPTKALQRHGLWPVGLDHAQSAARHLGAYLIRNGALKP